MKIVALFFQHFDHIFFHSQLCFSIIVINIISTVSKNSTNLSWTVATSSSGIHFHIYSFFDFRLTRRKSGSSFARIFPTFCSYLLSLSILSNRSRNQYRSSSQSNSTNLDWTGTASAPVIQSVKLHFDSSICFSGLLLLHTIKKAEMSTSVAADPSSLPIHLFRPKEFLLSLCRNDIRMDGRNFTDIRSLEINKLPTSPASGSSEMKVDMPWIMSSVQARLGNTMILAVITGTIQPFSFSSYAGLLGRLFRYIIRCCRDLSFPSARL
jgi:hypothetical protein